MGEIKRQIVVGVACALIGFVGAMGALGFLSLAVFFWLSPYMGPGWAAALTALIIALAAVLAIVIVRLVMNPRPRIAPARAAAPPPPPPSGGSDYAAELGAMFAEQAQEFAKRRPITTVVGSLVLGFAVGVSPSLRDAIRRALFR